MTRFRLIQRSLIFHWRSHLGVVLGAMIGSAALIGALVVGDSVRESLKDRAEARLGAVELALSSGDRLFQADLGGRLEKAIPGQATNTAGQPVNLVWGGTHEPRAHALVLQGVAVKQDGSARAHQVQILGSTVPFWLFSLREKQRMESMRSALWRGRPSTSPSGLDDLALERAFMEEFGSWRKPAPGGVRLNRALAEQLSAKPGDTVILRFAKPSALSQDAVLSPRNEASVAMRLVVEDIVEGERFGEFSLKSGQRPALNAFVNESELWRVSGVTNRANLLLVHGGYLPRPVSPWREKLRQSLQMPGNAWPRPIRDMLLRSLRRGLEPTPAESEVTLRHVTDELRRHWRLADAEIEVRAIEEPVSRTGGDFMPPMIEVATRRIFLDTPVRDAGLTPRKRLLRDHADFTADREEDLTSAAYVTNGIPILTYLANSIRVGDRLTPYSIVTAAGAPWTPTGMRDDEIVVNEWLAKDLGVKVGDRLELTYYDPEAGARLLEKTNVFTIRQVVPLKGLYADRTLMPEFPGLSKAESTRDWDAGFPLVHSIRDEDEAYWKAHRGTPKAYVTEAAGRTMWGNRFGDLTAIRYPVPPTGFASGFQKVVEANLVANLNPADLGLVFRPVRSEAFRAATSGQDFGGLFIGFSFFLVLAALLLMALMFQFGLEQRLPEVGMLLAVGFRPKAVRRLWLAEALALAAVGGVLGAVEGLGYAQAMIHGLGTLWRDAVAGTPLSFHVTPGTLVVGLMASVVVCGVTIWLTMRRQFARSPRALLAGVIEEGRLGGRSRGFRVGWMALVLALGLAGWALVGGDRSNAGIFFGAGSLILISGLSFAAGLLRQMQGETTSLGGVSLSPGKLAVRGTARRRSRSLATVGLLASGVFLVASLGAFRMDAGRDAMRRTSGTGGFALVGESSLPISVDLNRAAGWEQFGLGADDLAQVHFVPFRVREGDDASCLNLDRAQRPRLMGVQPEMLAERGAFRFGGMAKGVAEETGWLALKDWKETGGVIEEVPAVGDVASIQWALGKKLGDTLDMTDERGRAFRIRLVGGVVNSILQGSLVIDEAALTRLFPGVSGYRWFLVDAEAGKMADVSAKLSRAMADVGMELAPATRRLGELNAVQNTYLSTFQVLGGLGLLLGSAGLGVVVLRNVLERRGELGLLMAVGFRRREIVLLVLREHLALLAVGLGIGLVAAVVAVLPSLWGAGSELPVQSLVLTLGSVMLLGGLTTWAATRMSVRGSLLAALRGE